MRFLFSAAFVFLGFFASAQEKFTLNGYVKDSASGESIIGATVSINGSSVTSNQYGFYSITLEPGTYDVLVSHVAYLTQTFQLKLEKNLGYDILLISRAAAMNEVVVSARKRDNNVKTAQMGKIDLSVNQVKNIPAFF